MGWPPYYPEPDRVLDVVPHSLQFFLHFVLPNANYDPTLLFQVMRLPKVAVDILNELVGPERLFSLRRNIVEGATMPEATIHKDNDMTAKKHQVRAAG